MTESPQNTRKSIADEFTERIISQLKEGAAPWQKSWKAGEFHRPFNLVTGKEYRGANVAVLAGHGLADPRWMTYKQAQAEGWQVKKGAKAQHVVFWQWHSEQTMLDEEGRPVLDDNGQELKERIDLDRPRMYAYNVFPISQVQDGNGRDIPAYEAKAPDWNPHERAEAILRAAGVSITHDQLDRAFYRPGEDAIHLPPKENFPEAGEYYATALHELGHALGHSSRLNWPTSAAAAFVSPEYAQEELRVEIASWMLCQELGLPHNPGNHIAYTDFWIKGLEDDHYEIMRACQAAEKIMGHILDVELGHALGRNAEKNEPVLVTGRPTAVSEQKVYLEVPFREKGRAKALGATWDNGKGLWCARPGVDLVPLAGWMSAETRAELADILPAGEVARGAAVEQPPVVTRAYYSGTEGEGLESAWTALNAQKLTAAKREAAINERGGEAGHKIVVAIGETRTTSEGVATTRYLPIADRAMGGGKWRMRPVIDLEALGVLAPQPGRASRPKEGEAVEKEAALDSPEKRLNQAISDILSAHLNCDETTPEGIQRALIEGEAIAEKAMQSSDFGAPGAEAASKALEEILEAFTLSNSMAALQRSQSDTIKLAYRHLPAEELGVVQDKQKAVRQAAEPATEKTYLHVPFKEKEEAKVLGAKWDRNAGLWYAPEGADLAPLAKFIPEKEPAPAKTISPEAELAEALEKAGLKINGLPIIDGKIHRVPSMGGKPGNRDGAYCAYADGRPAGWYMNYRTGGEKVNWVSSGQTLTPEQKVQLAQEGDKRRAEREAERQKAQEDAIQKANEKLQSSLEAYVHPYLDGKALVGLKGLKVEKQYNLMVPGYDTDGNLKTIQTINDQGGKFFELGCPKAGALHVVGRDGGQDTREALKGPDFYICEGYATGASVHMASPEGATVVAFDANNLKAVAMAIREINPTAGITICADNDHQAEKNVGLEKATEAALAVGGKVVSPDFTPEEKAQGLTDFNDLHQARGLDAVRNFLTQNRARSVSLDQAKPQAQGQVRAAVSPPAPQKAVGLGR